MKARTIEPDMTAKDAVDLYRLEAVKEGAGDREDAIPPTCRPSLDRLVAICHSAAGCPVR
jgi:hypothetical protein